MTSVDGRALIILLLSFWLLFHSIQGVNTANTVVAPSSISLQSKTQSEQLLNTEIAYTKRQIELYNAKSALLKKILAVPLEISSSDDDHTDRNKSIKRFSKRQSWRLDDKPRDTRWSEWFRLQQSWYLPTQEPQVMFKLLSFKFNRPSATRKAPQLLWNPKSSQYEVQDDPLQFVSVLNAVSGKITIQRPQSKEKIWVSQFSTKNITDVTFSSDKSSFFGVIGAQGHVEVYYIRVWQDMRVIGGNFRRVRRHDAPFCWQSPAIALQTANQPLNLSVTHYNALSQPAPFQTHLEMELLSQFSTENNTKQEGSTSYKLAVVQYHEQIYIVTANTTGHIKVHHPNTTMLHSFQWPRPIQDLEVLVGGVVAFASANEIGFIDVLNGKLLPFTCKGATDGITHISRDVWRPTSLFAGTSKGKVLRFRVNRMGFAGRNNGFVQSVDPTEEASCVLLDQLQPQINSPFQSKAVHSIHTSVANLPGFVVFATENTLVLYDSSKMSGSARLLHLAEKPMGILQDERVLGVHVAKDLENVVLLAVEVEEVEKKSNKTRRRIDFYESRLPLLKDTLELGWIRAPMVALCVVGALLWRKLHRSKSNGDLDHPGMDPSFSMGPSMPYKSSGFAVK